MHKLLGQKKELFLEIQDDFCEKFIEMCEEYDTYVAKLQKHDDYKENVNDFFRLFHSMKADAYYLGAPTLMKAFAYLEDILDALRNQEPPVKDEIIQWLYTIGDHMATWQDAIKIHDYNVQALDTEKLKEVKAKKLPGEDSHKILATKTVLIIEREPRLSKLLKKHVEASVQKVYILNDVKMAAEIIASVSPHFILISSLVSHEILKAIFNQAKQSTQHSVRVFVNTTKEKQKEAAYFRRFGIEVMLEFNASQEKLLSHLHQLAKKHFSKRWMLLGEHALKRHIKTLKPLNQVVQKIQELNADEESTPREMAVALTKDPILTANLLKYVNSPQFGLVGEVSNINHCVSMMGKSQTAAIVFLNSFKGAFAHLDLKAYGISEESLFLLSKKRMEFMFTWYGKVKFMMLPILTSSALLGNLGQIIIAQELEEKKRSEAFLEVVKTEGTKIAEAQFVNITAEEVTADMLKHWNMEELLTESIRYSYSPHEAPEQVKDYAIANYVVFNTFSDLNVGLNQTQVNKICRYLKKHNLDEKIYLEALKKLS